MSPSGDKSLAGRGLLWLIARYQSSGGARRWFGVECNFEPSCSGYGAEAIQRFGLRRGLVLTWGRLRRCQQRDSFCKCLEPVPAEWGDVKKARG